MKYQIQLYLFFNLLCVGSATTMLVTEAPQHVGGHPLVHVAAARGGCCAGNRTHRNGRCAAGPGGHAQRSVDLLQARRYHVHHVVGAVRVIENRIYSIIACSEWCKASGCSMEMGAHAS